MDNAPGQALHRRMAELACNVGKTYTSFHLLDVDIRISCRWLEPNVLTSAALRASVAGDADVNDVAWHKIPAKTMI